MISITKEHRGGVTICCCVIYIFIRFRQGVSLLKEKGNLQLTAKWLPAAWWLPTGAPPSFIQKPFLRWTIWLGPSEQTGRLDLREISWQHTYYTFYYCKGTKLGNIQFQISKNWQQVISHIFFCIRENLYCQAIWAHSGNCYNRFILKVNREWTLIPCYMNTNNILETISCLLFPTWLLYEFITSLLMCAS